MVSARKGKGVDDLKAFLEDMVGPPLGFGQTGLGSLGTSEGGRVFFQLSQLKT